MRPSPPAHQPEAAPSPTGTQSTATSTTSTTGPATTTANGDGAAFPREPLSFKWGNVGTGLRQSLRRAASSDTSQPSTPSGREGVRNSLPL